MHRSVPLDHVFCPACDPHFPALAANKKTTILIPATSHSSPLYSEDGSSAFSCVTSECSAGVKLHDGLRAEFRHTPVFLLLESASTSQVSSPVIAPRIVCADDPRSEEHTSELQSQSNLVCRLLLEKKKNHFPSSRLTIKNKTTKPTRSM